MKLKRYQQKRDFDKTSEPKGKIKNVLRSKNLFVIQKHAARHLHYDLRLELNGVLLSWAIPKGPSLDPSVKRLAVHVEDHPIEYGFFEGNIPQKQYGAGAVMLWDKGQWHCDDKNPGEAYKKGKLTFTLKAKKLKGKWSLVRMHQDDETWLLIKMKDKYANSSKKFDITVEKPNSVISKRSIDEIANDDKNDLKIHLSANKFPKMIYPELATLVDQPPVGKKWLHEIKFDGYRLLTFKNKNKIQIFTRNHHDWTHKFKIIEKEVSKLSKKNLILDGEVVVLDKKQHSNFQLLQKSIKNKLNNFYYYLFDILYFDKFNLTTLPLIERKNILKKLLSKNNNDILRYSDHVQGRGDQVLKKACKLGLEGIVSKEMNSHYSQKRDLNWLKTKCIKRQKFVIIGFNKSSKRKYFRSLVLGLFNKKGELIYCGNVGTGFTEISSKQIHALLSKNISKKMPLKKLPSGCQHVTWLKPKIVAEVEFIEWTKSGILRHPSFKGIRTDKPAKKITKEISYETNASK